VVPAWHREIAHLRKNPTALAGTFSFISPDDTFGRIRIGPSADDPTDPDSADWDSLW
jgi:hypothetical protein